MLTSLFGRVLILLAAVIFVILQAKLWLGADGILDRQDLDRQIAAQKAENQRLAERNRVLEAEVRDLKTGIEAVEEHARLDLGMVKNGETFLRVTRSEANASSTATAP